MDNRKFEKLIDLIINENEEQARELFHDIVVEKSREIYESIMDEEMMGDDMGGQVGGLLDEINAEEMNEEDDEFGGDEDMGDDDLGDLEGGDEEEVIDIDADDIGDEAEGEEVEDAVIRIEDKLDQLMAEFEELMGSDEGDEEFGADEMDAGAEDMEAGEEEMGAGEEEMDAGAEDEEAMMEAVQLKNIPGLYGSKIGGDNGAQPKSAVGSAANAGQAGMASKPVKFSGQAESVPTGPKGPTGYPAKGETQVKDANNWKNAAGGSTNAGKTSFTQKAPRDFGKKDSSTGKEVGASGSVTQNDKSPVAESRRVAKKRI